jgi:hypothetical protein
MIKVRSLVTAAFLVMVSGCDFLARPATFQERQLIRATTAELTSQAKMIDMSLCLDRSTDVQRNHVIFPNLWEPAQFSDPVWRAYDLARPPAHSVRVPSSGLPEAVSVGSALWHDLFCRGWRTKLYTPVFSGAYAFVVVEDAVIFFIYAFVNEKGGWRLIRFGTTRKNSIRY